MADLGPGLLAIGGVVLGGLISGGTTYFVGKLDRDHQRQLAEVERTARREEARDSYQVETLLELQLALQRLGRACGASFHEDVIHHRTTQEPYGRQQLSALVNRELHEAGVAVRILASRVIADGPRAASLRAQAHASVFGRQDSEQAAEAALLEGVALFETAQEAIAQALRTLPAPISYRPMITTAVAPDDLRPGEG